PLAHLGRYRVGGSGSARPQLHCAHVGTHVMKHASAARGRQMREIRIALFLITATLVVGCASGERAARTQEQLLATRADSDQRAAEHAKELVGALLQRTKTQYDDYAAHRRPDPPIVD